MRGVNTDYCVVAGRPPPNYVIAVYDKTHTPIDVIVSVAEAHHYVDECLTNRWLSRFSLRGVKERFSLDT